MKFVMYIDYAAGSKKFVEYREMQATDLEAAIIEADAAIEASEEEIYLTRIMKKVGKIEKVADFKTETFQAVLCRRSAGWHLNNDKNCENTHIAKRMYGKGWEYYTAI